MNKENIKLIAQGEGFSAEYINGDVDINPDLYDFAESLLKAYHLECLMRLNRELDKYTFMGKEWKVINDCQSALSELVTHNLNSGYRESEY